MGDKILKTMEVERDPALSFDQTTPFLLSPKVKDQNNRGLDEAALSNGTIPKSTAFSRPSFTGHSKL